MLYLLASTVLFAIKVKPLAAFAVAAVLIANADVIDEAQLERVHGKIVYEGPGRMVIIKDSSAH